MTPRAPQAADFLIACYRAALAAVEPRQAMRQALSTRVPGEGPVCLIAAGKAAPGMATGLVEWLASHHRQPAMGLLIADAPVPPPHPGVTVVAGEHPVPHDGSARASAMLEAFVGRIPLDAEVHVAISGGASALLAGPLPGLQPQDVTTTFEVLLASNLDIHQVNAVRKRVTRWSAGRLALALQPRNVAAWLISDVPGDDPATIASGPCVGDPWSSPRVVALCRQHRLTTRLPPAVVTALEFETPKSTDPRATARTVEIIASNRVAAAAAAARAQAAGCLAKVAPQPLVGEAADAGRDIARRMVQSGSRRIESGLAPTELHEPPRVLVYGGETTVTFDGPPGRGGRSQELALAAAEVLAGSPTPVALLAAGTDGRDGPTDAAGAVVSGETWNAIAAAGRDPAAALSGHDAYPALAAVGALLRTGTSGTNVMDLVIAFSDPAARR